MTAESTTLAGRAEIEALMVDECTITRGGDTGTMNETTLQYDDPEPGTTVYTGKCRVKHASGQASDRVIQYGEQAVSLWPFQVSIPVSVTGVQVDDIVTITSSTLDPDLVDTELRVRDVVRGTHITARRLGCELNAG